MLLRMKVRPRQVLTSLPLLHQLTLHGCPVAKADDYAEAVLRELPLVEQLDGRRVRDRIRGRMKGGVGAAPAVRAAEADGTGAVDGAARKRKAGGSAAASALDAPQQKVPLSKRARTGDPAAEVAGSAKQRRKAKDLQAEDGDKRKHVEARMPSAALKSSAPPAAELDSESDSEAMTPSAAIAADRRTGQSFLEEVLDDSRVDDAAAGQHGAKVQKKREDRSGVVKVIDVAQTQSGKATGNKLKQGRRSNGAQPGQTGSKAAIRGTSAAQLLARGELSAVAAGGTAATSAWD